jgi:hypothetical protein
MSSPNRKFKGVWIPAETWLDRDLSITEKVMLVEIDSLDNGPRGCFSSNAHFAEFFGLSISRVSEIISGLATKGLVDVEQIREGKRVIERRIRVSEPIIERRKSSPDPFGKPKTPSENAANPFGKHVEPPSENTQGSNTNTNNTKRVKNTDAFELYWASGTKQGSKKKAAGIFDAICKRDKRDPMEFATLLINDVNARLKAKQYGFDKLHGTTYLNQERWTDAIPTASTSASRPSGITKDFSHSTYQGTPNDQFADIFQ